MTLENISQLRDPSERVPLGERIPYENALHLIQQAGFDGFDLRPSPRELMQLQLFFTDGQIKKGVIVKISEERPAGPLAFSCSLCLVNGRRAATCLHQWAAFVLLWQALTVDPDQFQNDELRRLSGELRTGDALNGASEGATPDPEFAGVTLDSLSLFLDEPALLKGPPLESHMKLNLSKYRAKELAKNQELLSPRLWNLPEVFRKRLTAYSESYQHEVNKQNRLADILRYNFSNGMQVSAQEILRHPLQKKVPGDLLPQAKTPASVFAQWPLIQQSESRFVSQAVIELEEIMQALLAQVASRLRQKKTEVYLQTKSHPNRAMRLSLVEFDPTTEVDWRVEFVEKKQLETEFRLMSFRKQPLFFYESFAIEATEGVLVVHSWQRELSQLQETIRKISGELHFTSSQMPTLEVYDESEARALLTYLRSRSLPVKISGETRILRPEQSQTEIRMDETANFVLQHDARIMGQKNLVRQGWSTTSELYLQTLARGLPYFLKIEAREIAARVGAKRDWDLKFLKHLGVLQLIFLEVLALHFDGTLTDGTPIEPSALLPSLYDKIKALLMSGTSGVLVAHVPLNDLCSRSVLACFENFINSAFEALGRSESFYSEAGEVVLEGVVEREFRLIYELLRRSAVLSGGEIFRKSRTSFLSRVTKHNPEKDRRIPATFHFPGVDGPEGAGVQGSFESLQQLIPHGFKIFYKDQPLQELTEDEFHVDFVLQSDSDERFFNWFELNPKFFLRGQEVEAENFLSLGEGGVIEFEGKLFLVPQKQMPSLRRLEKFWQKLQKGKTETAKKKNGEKVYQLPRHQTLELLALRASGVAIRGDHEWQRLCDFYDGLGRKTREINLPASIKGVLKPYQVLGVQWLQDLYHLKLGALLADDMGLGKTLQTLAFLDDLRDKGEMGQVLIVVPSSLIYNWQSEAEKFTPELAINVFSSRDQDRIGRRLGAKDQMVVITTYGLLMENEAFLCQYQWKVLIFDEAQNLKNITTKRTSAARSLPAQFRICLTGTPMENHYGEFYSLVDLLVPGSLGKVEDFRRQFVNTEMVTREEMDDLKLKIKPLLLRRTKKEILDQLPEKQVTKVSIAFEDRQKEIYRDIALSYNQRVQETLAVQGEASVQLQMLTALLRLRQACSDPAALPNIRYDKVPPKLEALMDSVQEIVESGESALVFTQFLQTLEHTQKLLKNLGIPVFVLHGGVPTKQRQKLLADFNKTPGGAVLLMTLKTGGVGLNLTKASYVFHIEPWWNPSVENQATDRVHRLGQSRAVQVFRYIMHESLEEKIELLKDRKDRKFQSLFSTTEKDVEVGAGRAGLSKDDFDLLLGIR